MPFSNPRIIQLPKISDPRGNLTFIQDDGPLPYTIRRVYYLYDVPGGERRGGHAHAKLEQLLIAASGSFDVLLDRGGDKQRFTLRRPDEGLYIPPMYWRELEHFSSGAVSLVLASLPYDESDYFRDYGEYLAALNVKS